MTMLAAVKQDAQLMTLADYEARIYLYKEQIGVGYIGIGRTLIEAKEADVVPHGEWEAWVTRTTGLNPRQAQRCMQAAREIKDGSALARLEMSKALLVLQSGLNEETQEKIAQQAADEGATVKQLREALQQARGELTEARTETRKEYEGKLQFVNSQRRALEDRIREAEERLAESDARACQAWDEGYKSASGEAQMLQAQVEALKAERASAGGQIEELREELDAAEAREERRAKELEQLRREHQQHAMDDARGLATSSLTGFDLAAAVRAFIGSAGVLPQMGSTLRTASPAERETIRQNIETVANWVNGARAALGCYMVPDSDIVVE